jgi:hypothetical protein
MHNSDSGRRKQQVNKHCKGAVFACDWFFPYVCGSPIAGVRDSSQITRPYSSWPESKEISALSLPLTSFQDFLLALEAAREHRGVKIELGQFVFAVVTTRDNVARNAQGSRRKHTC